MSDNKSGAIGWADLSVDNGEGVREFYEGVVGWCNSPVQMGEYQDYCMVDSQGDAVAGICHARGPNAKLPPQWLIYINVADLEESLEKCKSLGGQLLDGPRPAGGGRMAVIKDPAGAVAALFQPEA